MSEELKPCPFCNDGTRNLSIRGDCDICYVQCDPCGTRGPAEAVGTGEAKYNKAITAWNSITRRLKWTKEKPKEPGWYWHHQGLGFGTVIEYIDLEIGIPGGVLEDELWAGPIPEPEEE